MIQTQLPKKQYCTVRKGRSNAKNKALWVLFPYQLVLCLALPMARLGNSHCLQIYLYATIADFTPLQLTILDLFSELSTILIFIHGEFVAWQ